MKICIFSSFFPKYSGGSEYQAYLIAKCLREKGFDVFFLGIGGHKSGKYIFNGFKVYVINANRNLHSLGNCIFLLYPKIYEILKKEKPDIVYTRNGSAVPGLLAIIARKINYRFIYGLAHDNRLQNSILNAGIRPFNQIDSFFHFYGLHHAEKIIAQTKYQKKMLKKKYSLDSHVIRNAHPIPKDFFMKSKKVIKVFFIANYKPFKRPGLFIKLSECFVNREHVKFIMIGRAGNDNHWKKKIAPKIAKKCNLIYLGEISQKKINDYLSSGHILVNTSIAEGFSNTFIQAWLRRVPVVSLAVNPDHLLSEHGLGFCSGSFENLIRDVNRLIEDHNLRKRMGEKACRFAVENFDIDKIGKKFHEFICKLIK